MWSAGSWVGAPDRDGWTWGRMVISDLRPAMRWAALTISSVTARTSVFDRDFFSQPARKILPMTSRDAKNRTTLDPGSFTEASDRGAVQGSRANPSRLAKRPSAQRRYPARSLQ